MHRTQAATESFAKAALRKLLHTGAALAILCQPAALQVWAAELHLDLTHDDFEPGEAESPWAHGLPSGTFGGVGGLRPLLPVKLSIRDISPRLVTSLDHITVDVLLRNVGKAAIELPFRSGNHWRAGVHGQRSIDLALELTAPNGNRVLIPLGNAYGASDIPGSMVALAPNDTLAIHASASLRETWAWSGALPSPAEVKIAVTVGELRWHDTRFEIVGGSMLDKATSPTVLTWSAAK